MEKKGLEILACGNQTFYMQSKMRIVMGGLCCSYQYLSINFKNQYFLTGTVAQ